MCLIDRLVSAPRLILIFQQKQSTLSTPRRHSGYLRGWPAVGCLLTVALKQDSSSGEAGFVPINYKSEIHPGHPLHPALLSQTSFMFNPIKIMKKKVFFVFFSRTDDLVSATDNRDSAVLTLHHQLWMHPTGTFKHVSSWSLTLLRIWIRSDPRRSCIGCSPSAARPPPAAAPRSRAPGTPLGPWSGSPSVCGHLANVWRPCCSSSSSASTSRPGSKR